MEKDLNVRTKLVLILNIGMIPKLVLSDFINTNPILWQLASHHEQLQKQHIGFPSSTESDNEKCFVCIVMT